jgi:hypothetical protein
LHAQSAAAIAPPADPRASLAEARELIKSGEYAKTVDVLRASREAMRGDASLLAENYLLLIKTYVFMGNELRNQPNGRPSAEAVYDQASEMIAECLAIPALRHTRPEPETDYPPEMVQLFREVRDTVQGGLRITSLDPPEAVVLLQGDTLRASSAAALLEATDLPIGVYRLEVHAPRFVSIREELQITPGAMLERPYTLKPKRGTMWYATRVAGAVGAVAAIVLIAQPKKTSEPDLGEPPPPPTGPRR